MCSATSEWLNTTEVDAEEEGGVITEIKVMVQKNKRIKQLQAYWDTELASAAAHAKPSNTFYYRCEQMKVLARSRDGQFVACASFEEENHSSKNKLFVLQKKKMKKSEEEEDGEREEEEWTVIREVVLRTHALEDSVIITDPGQSVTIQANLQKEEEEEDVEEEGLLFLEKATCKKKSSNKLVAVQVPPATVIMQMHGCCVWCVTLKKEAEDTEKPNHNIEDMILGGAKAKALGCYIQKHTKRRRKELTNAFERFALSDEEPVDFMLNACSDPRQFPSLFSVVKKTGRPSFSVDKGPRVGRSPPLNEDEEIEVRSIV